MATAFEDAFEQLMMFEGVHSDDPRDAGGDTWFGIARREHPEVAPWPPTKESAMAWYEIRYWKACQLDALAPEIASRIFIFAVNTNSETAIRCLQAALTWCGYEDLRVDGALGAKTIAAAADAAKGQLANLLARLRAQFVDYHVEKILNDAAKACYLEGWLWRDCW